MEATAILMLKINFKDKEEGGEGEGDCGMAQQKQVLRTSLI